MNEPKLADFAGMADVEKRELLFTLFSLRAGVPPELIVRRITVMHGEHYERQAQQTVRAACIDEYGAPAAMPDTVRRFVDPPPPAPPAGLDMARRMFREGKDVDQVGAALWDMYRRHDDPRAIITHIIEQALAKSKSGAV